MEKLERLIANTEEVVTIEELKTVLNKQNPKAYIGFEPSGVVHLGWKICTNKIKDFLACGFDFTILLADWHAYINDKLGGDLEKIKLCGKYMEDCFTAMGIEKEKVRFVYASDYVNDSKYWELVLKTAKATSVARVKRAMDIMGRAEDEADKDLSKLFYPAMQVSDIFYLNLDVAYGGMDQRHAHMLARDVAKKLGLKPPVAVHTPLLTGLQAGSRMNPIESPLKDIPPAGQADIKKSDDYNKQLRPNPILDSTASASDFKMSKSKPETMISIHDLPDIVKKKMSKAYCPEKQIEGNPVLEICKFVIFPDLDGKFFLIERPEKFGGNLEFKTYEALAESFAAGLHPLDLKNATANHINKILEPVHAFFEKHPENFQKMKTAGILQ
jgi:tyrosyl-tRNA synthetase